MKSRMFFSVGRNWLLALCAVGSQVANAETVQLNLEKAIEYAVKQNPSVRIANQDIELKKLDDKETTEGLYPTLDFTGSFTHNFKVQTIHMMDRDIKMGSPNTVNAGLALNIPVYSPSLYKTMKLTKTDISLAVEASRSSKLDLIKQVSKAYYQLLLAQDSYEVLAASYSVAEQNYKVISDKFDQGRVSEYDKISAEVQARNIKPQVVSAKNSIALAKLQLKVLMGMDSNVEIEVNDKLENYEAQLKDQIQMSSLSLEDNTTLRQLDLNQQLLNHNLAISKTSFLPTVSLSGAYLYTSMSDNWNLFKYKYNPYVYATLNVTIPIFRAKNWTSLKKVKMQQRELALNRTNAERQINMQVQTYLDNMSASQEQVESNKEAVVKSEKARTIAEKRYEVGKGTILELNSSVVDVTSAKLTYKQSIYDYLSARTDLNYVLGHESKYLEMEPEDDGSVLKAKKPAKENANNNDNK